MTQAEVRQFLLTECGKFLPTADCHKLLSVVPFVPERKIDWWMYVLAGFIVGKLL